MPLRCPRAASKHCCPSSLVDVDGIVSLVDVGGMVEGIVEIGSIVEGIIEVGSILEGVVEGDTIGDSDGTVVGDGIIGAFPSSMAY